MPMPHGFEWIAALPPALQFLVMLGVGIGLAAWGRGGYNAGRKEAPVTTQDVVLTAAGITDMTPVKELAAELKGLRLAGERIADELGTIRQILAEDAEHRHEERTYRRGLDAGRREPATRRR